MTLCCWLRRLGTVLTMLVLGACTVYSVPGGHNRAPVEGPGEPPVIQEPGLPPASPAPAPEPNASHAYGGLVTRAREAANTGDYERALGLLERAQRIDPASGEVYLALAQTYSAQGQVRQARAMAERGLLYCREGQQCQALQVLAGNR